MYRLSSKIVVTKKSGKTFDWDFVTECEISGSWAEFTETAVLTFPKNVKFGDSSIVGGDNPLFVRGDQIKIALGYDDDLKVEFKGYISKIMPSTPIEIHCENEAYLLKLKTIKKLSFKSVSLGELLKQIVPSGIEVESVSAELGAFRITNATAMQCLDELKKTYGFPAFFKNGTLHVGQTYKPNLSKTHVIKFERDVSESSLEYRTKNEQKIKVKAISMLPDNTKLTVEAGDPDGEQRTLTYYNIKTTKELKSTASAEIDRLKYEGYFGSFTMFGTQFVQHQHTVELLDDKFPERRGEYFVKSHTINFGQSGFRRVVELGIKSL